VFGETSAAPSVWSTYHGPPHVSQRLADYLRTRRIVHLPNLPRTPQHNAAAERGEGELKAGARFLRADDPATRARKLFRTADRLNRYRRRATRKGLTAHEADLILPRATSIVAREDFYEACRQAVEEAVQALTSRRARRLAEREAILAVMERYGLVKITGGRRRAAPRASFSNEAVHYMPGKENILNRSMLVRRCSRGPLLTLIVLGVVACGSSELESQENGEPVNSCHRAILHEAPECTDSWLLDEFIPLVLRGIGGIPSTEVRHKLSESGVIGIDQIDIVGRKVAQFDGSGELAIYCDAGWISVISKAGVFTEFIWTSKKERSVEVQSPEAIRSASADSADLAVALWRAKPDSFQCEQVSGGAPEIVASWSRVIGFSHVSVAMIDGAVTSRFDP
jgi:hypothetical protein